MPSTPPMPSQSAQPPAPDPVRTGRGTSALVLSPWNLLLLVPLLMLVTPWFNRVDPRLGGLPFFYWFQFAFVIVGVACVWIVYAATRRRSLATATLDTATPDRLSVDDLDEGDRS
jgi:hypothetical protein